MVTQATQDFVFQVVDANNEYNTKFILFCLIFIYLIFTLWFANRIIPFSATRDQIAKFPVYQQISVPLMRVGSVIFLTFYPLIISIVMYREYDIDSMLTLMITGYSVLTLVSLGLWFLFGLHWVQQFLELIGIDTGSRKGTIIRRKD